MRTATQAGCRLVHGTPLGCLVTWRACRACCALPLLGRTWCCPACIHFRAPGLHHKMTLLCCRYDAYGMTIVEAASQGAPTLVQGGGHVGATDLLSADGGEVLCCDMDQPAAQVGPGVWAQLRRQFADAG